VSAVLATATFPAVLSAKRKDDRLVLSNGDQLIGEIKKLEHGELFFKSDYMLDTSQVDWARVQELQSLDLYQVFLTSGLQFVGTIHRFADGKFVIDGAGPGVPPDLTWADVAIILPRERSFWAQLQGNVSSGFSYTSGNSQTQWSLNGQVIYPGDHMTIDLSGSSTFSGQSGGTSTSRNTGTLTDEITFKRNWFALALIDLLQSQQQDLNLRTTAGGGVGRFLFRTGRTSFVGFAGLVYTHEDYATPTDATNPNSNVTDNLESVFGLDFATYRFKTTQLTARYSVYPSLSTLGRVRMAATSYLNFEIAHNLYWSFSLYENYDSKPPVNANKNDFGVTNSIGWKF
jgi:hypothetical protein